MDCTAWRYIASREANRLNVLTRSIEQTQQIKDLLEELGLENSPAFLLAKGDQVGLKFRIVEVELNHRLPR